MTRAYQLPRPLTIGGEVYLYVRRGKLTILSTAIAYFLGEIRYLQKRKHGVIQSFASTVLSSDLFFFAFAQCFVI